MIDMFVCHHKRYRLASGALGDGQRLLTGAAFRNELLASVIHNYHFETDVEDGCLLKPMERGTATTGFHVIRLTEASFIVATPTRAAQPCALTQTAVVALGSRQSNLRFL
jgi:hypothetical protein